MSLAKTRLIKNFPTFGHFLSKELYVYIFNLYVFIRSLFNNDISDSGFIALNYWMIVSN
jgi:hypothetical protein